MLERICARGARSAWHHWNCSRMTFLRRKVRELRGGSRSNVLRSNMQRAEKQSCNTVDEKQSCDLRGVQRSVTSYAYAASLGLISVRGVSMTLRSRQWFAATWPAAEPMRWPWRSAPGLLPAQMTFVVRAVAFRAQRRVLVWPPFVSWESVCSTAIIAPIAGDEAAIHTRANEHVRITEASDIEWDASAALSSRGA